MVELLLEKGKIKLFGPIDDEGNGALHLAARGSVETLKFVLEKGAFVNVPTSESKATALHMAVSAGRIENVKLLLEKNADINKATAMGMTPLMLCVDGGDSEVALNIAKLLIDAKADLNKADAGGSTAYDIAESNNSYAMAMLLREKGAVPRGIPANTVGVEAFNVQSYYNKGQSPGPRTRVASIMLGSTLYVGGGLTSRSMADIEAALSGATEEIDESLLLPFEPSAEVFSADLSQISMQPLVEDLSQIRGSHVKLSTQIKGDHLAVHDDGVVEVKFEACCGSEECTDDACAEKKEAESHDHNDHDDEDDVVFTTSILAEESFTAQTGPIAYFEVTVLEAPKKNIIASIGFTSSPGEWEFERHPGWTENSIGYHSDDGKPRVPVEDTDEINWVGHPWTVHDTVGAGFIFATKETFFTLNGKFLGVAALDLEFGGDDIRAAVGFGTNGLKVKANFGTSPFLFDFHVKTVTWTKLKDLPNNILAFLPLAGSTDSFMVIPDSTKAIYHYTPSTGAVVVKETKAPKIPSIPLHAEHSVHLVGNKVVLFSRIQALLQPGKRKTAVVFVLDLATNTWSDVVAPTTLAQKKLAKALIDADCQLSAAVLNGAYYIFSPEKAYQLNLDNLSLTAIKLTGLPPNEDMAFYNTKDGRALCYCIGPNLSSYRFHMIDIAKKQWLVPRFTGTALEPLVGKGCVEFEGKLFFYGGFSSETGAPKDSFSSISLSATVDSPIAVAFDDSSKTYHSDFVVKVADKAFHLHKSILAARSPYFAALLEADASLAEHTLPAEWNANLATAVLKYLYTDCIDISLANASNHKDVTAIVKVLAEPHERRIVEELLFSRTMSRSTLASDLLSVLSSKKFVDATIEATGGSVSAHRVVLAVRNAELMKFLASNSKITLDHPVAAVEETVKALYSLGSYSLASVPRSNWKAIADVAKALSINCLQRLVLTAEQTTHDAIPQAVPQ